MTPNTNPSSHQAPSILKSLALAVGTLTLSTWALGTLWMQSEQAEQPEQAEQAEQAEARVSHHAIAATAP